MSEPLPARMFVDETKEIEREYNGSDESLVQHKSSRDGAGDSTARESDSHCPEVMNERHTISSGDQNDQLTVSVGDRLSERAPEMIVGTFRQVSSSRPLQYLQPHPPPIPERIIYTTRNNTSLINISSQGANQENHETILPQEVLAWPINDHIKACLLSSYFQGTSRWCEVTNSLQPFSALSSHLVMESQAFSAAAVALASITVTKRDDFSVLLTEELYAFARETLRRLKSEHCEGSLVATILLYMCCSALGKTIEAQSTLHECAELLQANGLNNSLDSLSTACFWAFARQDIWAAYFSGRSTLIPIEIWKVIPPGLPHAPIQDTYSNLAIWITARIINELSRQSADINEITLQNLWAELQVWVIERPIGVRCAMEVEASGDFAFPTILFSNSSAVCGNMYYHTGCILLLATGKIPDKSTAMASPICHARRIAAISITNNDQEIEDWTGWKTASYILELERLWGLD
ncbi:hypothetical protein V491_08172 [Pseudogymnoascus sp. VKM F-3775]|nr:hypothetical protein V491_08172 [Pseudogymnoascus sp. VKM F-3775]